MAIISVPTTFAQTTEYTLEHDGVLRNYLLHVPDVYTGDAPVPLVFVLHGGGGDAAGMVRLTQGRFDELSEIHNFIVVYPNGIDKKWNDGRTTNIENFSTADDVGFISALIDDLSTNYNIDLDKIFSTGMSNGGMMSYRFACELSDRIAGIAPVVANLSSDLSDVCTPEYTTDILIALGTDDPITPYDGGIVGILGIEHGNVLSADETVTFWADHFNCAAELSTFEYPNTALFDGTHITQIDYDMCDEDSRVSLMTIHGGGHTWAGGVPYLSRLIIGKTSKDIDVSDVIWDFFTDSTD